jgi:chromate transporter
MLIIMALAWVYVRFGSMPQAAGLLYGVKPVVISIIVQALWSLGRKAVKSPLTSAVGLAVLVLYFFGINEIALLFAGGLFVMIGANLRRLRTQGAGIFLAPPFIGSNWLASSALVSVPFSLPSLFLIFLKIGAVLYGSGYVLLAFLRADFVVRFGWLTDQQLMDAVAIGQVTPGPLFTTATFIGFILGGMPGALIATLGIFLPSFLFVAVSNPLIPRMRRSAWVGGLLDGVNVASLGLMAAVTWQLGRASLTGPLTILIALVSLVLLIRFKINSTWLIATGALIGLLAMALH